MKADKILELLKEKNVGYTLHTHPPVYTVEEAKVYADTQPGGHFKNLLLKRNKKKNELYLVVLQADKRMDFSSLSEKIGCKLSFAKEEILHDFDTIAGAVSPFVLLEDGENKITLYLDAELKGYSVVNFHPNDNSMTLGLDCEDFLGFLESISTGIHWI